MMFKEMFTEALKGSSKKLMSPDSKNAMKQMEKILKDLGINRKPKYFNSEDGSLGYRMFETITVPIFTGKVHTIYLKYYHNAFGRGVKFYAGGKESRNPEYTSSNELSSRDNIATIKQELQKITTGYSGKLARSSKELYDKLFPAGEEISRKTEPQKAKPKVRGPSEIQVGDYIFSKNGMEFNARVVKVSGGTVFVTYDIDGYGDESSGSADIRRFITGNLDDGYSAPNWTF